MGETHIIARLLALALACCLVRSLVPRYGIVVSRLLSCTVERRKRSEGRGVGGNITNG
jgi:hypothetical protein